MKASSSSSHHQYSYEPVAAAVEASPEQLTTSLTPSTNTDLPRATSTALIQVTAPATLPEGYSFEASLGDRVLTVQVPMGGVEEGQHFTVPLPADVESAVHARVQIPVGQWRDGLFCGNLCNYGVCHPHCWTACCCTTVGTAQVIRRMGLKWNGLQGTPHQATVAFLILVALAALYYTVRLGLWALLTYIDPERMLEDWIEVDDFYAPSEAWIEVDDFYVFWFWFFWVILAVILHNTRYHVRQRYGIPAEFPYADACLAFCCPCHAAGQLLRHTADYTVYPASVFTDRGVAAHAPEIV